MDVFRYLRVCAIVHGCARMCADVRGCAQLCADVHSCLWLYMVVLVEEKVLCSSLKLCGMVNPYPWINAHIRFRSYFHCDTEALLSGS